MSWSVKTNWLPGNGVFGMWQEAQFDVAAGHTFAWGGAWDAAAE